MLFRPGLLQAAPRSRRRLWGAVCVAVLIAVLAGVWFVVRSGGSSAAGDSLAGARLTPAPATTAEARGWNLHDGGNLSDQSVVAPVAAPDGSSVTGKGQQAEAAGPGDYVGFQPTSVVLPSGKRSSILPAGLNDDGTLAVPADPGRVGWWTGGAFAGERYGGVVLAGHVDTRAYGPGVLAEMRKVKKGEVITLGGTTATGPQQQKYRITQITQIIKARLAADTGAFDQDVSQRLVLITCGGPFNPQKHHYRDNIVVIATPVQ